MMDTFGFRMAPCVKELKGKPYLIQTRTTQLIAATSYKDKGPMSIGNQERGQTGIGKQVRLMKTKGKTKYSSFQRD